MMSRSFNGKHLALLGILLLLFYLGYRVYESRLEAAALADQTRENAIPTVAIVRPTPLPENDTITKRRRTPASQAMSRCGTSPTGPT
jgi:predicted negative regulator of RcsB-dependent stress response